MLKCPVLHCDVVIAPKKPRSSQQLGALRRHLTGRPSSWKKRTGHGLTNPAQIQRWLKIAWAKGSD